MGFLGCGPEGPDLGQTGEEDESGGAAGSLIRVLTSMPVMAQPAPDCLKYPWDEARKPNRQNPEQQLMAGDEGSETGWRGGRRSQGGDEFSAGP